MNKGLTFLTIFLIIIFLAFGLANAFTYNSNNTLCGTADILPLTSWVLGTGVSYSILGILFSLSLFLVLFADQPILLLFTAIFALAFSVTWTAIGSVIVFSYGFGCSSTNIPVWTVSVATVATFYAVIPAGFILSMLVVCNL